MAYLLERCAIVAGCLPRHTISLPPSISPKGRGQGSGVGRLRKGRRKLLFLLPCTPPATRPPSTKPPCRRRDSPRARVPHYTAMRQDALRGGVG